MNKPIAVVFATDARGILPLSVAVWSVVENAADDTVYNICVLIDGVGSETQSRLRKLVRKAGKRHCINFIEAGDIIPPEARVSERWPRVAWARIFIADLLPDESRAIYLDIDTLTCDDLTKLRDTPMGDAALGVVLEHESHDGSHFNERLHIPQHCLGYFNSGVLLMNLEVFRRDNLIARILAYAREHQDALTCPDQDALNGALCESLIQLHPRWNWHDGLTRLILKRDPSAALWRGNPPRQSIEAALYPGVLHYQGKNKPWNYNYRIEGQRYADAMLRAGLIEKGCLPGWSVKKWIKKKCYSFLYALTWLKIRRLAKRFGIPVVRR